MKGWEGGQNSKTETALGREGLKRSEESGGQLTWVTAAPSQDLIQEGSLVSGGQWDLPVT